MPRYHKYGSDLEKRRFSRLYKVLFIFLIAAVITGTCAALFRVNSIQVEGNARYTTQEVIDASGVKVDDSLIAMPTGQIAKAIFQQLPYVGRLAIQRVYPDKLIIQVTEQVAAASVDSADGRWLISAQGKLLERDEGNIQTIQVSGLTAVKPCAGEMLQTADEESLTLKYVKELLEVLEVRGMLGRCTALDCNDVASMTLNYSIYRLRLPKGGDYDYYIRFALNAFRTLEDGKLEQGQGGLLDLTAANGKGYFQPDET